MNLKTMLTETRQALSQLAGSRNRSYKDEELVFVMNKMQDRLLDACVQQLENGHYEVTDMAKIRPLYRADIPLQAHRTDATYALFPGDLLYPLSPVALYACDGAFSLETRLFHEVRILPTTKAAGPFYHLEIKMNGSTILTSPARYGYKDDQALDEVVRVALDALRYAGYEVLEESLGNMDRSAVNYLGGKVFYLRNKTTTGTLSVTLDGTAQETRNIDYRAIKAAGSVKTMPVTVLDHVVAHQHITTPYFKPSPSRIIAVVDGSELKFYGPHSGIVVGALLNYVRKPRAMSLILSRDCELPEPAQRKICDLTVEYLHNTVNPELYQVKAADNERRAPL